MLKNNKGITLAALVITIIILLILASVATVSGKGAIEYIKFNNAKAQFQTMQAQANSWYEDYKVFCAEVDKDTTLTEEDKATKKDEWIGKDINISNLDATLVYNTLYDEEKGTSDATGYRYFSSDYIKNDLDIDGISYDFLINISTGTVLLYGGITYKDKPYYSAEDFGINSVNYTEVSGNITFDTAVEDSKIRIYNITLPKDVSKYYIQYKNNKKGETYYTTLTSDKKEVYTYTNAEGNSVTDNNAWYIPIKAQSVNNNSNDESYIPYIEGENKEEEIANYTIKIITESSNIASRTTNVTKTGNVGYESYVGKTVEKKTTLRDTNEDKIVVPAGFTISTDSRVNGSEALIKNGLVVIAPDGSEFVWVPVEDVNTMYGTLEDGTKAGKLYNFTDSNVENNTAKNWTETNGVMIWESERGENSYREPDFLRSTYHGDAVTGDDTEGIGLLESIVGLTGTNEQILTQWKTNLKNEFNNMIDSVSKNGGFYVGRYETSLKEVDSKKIAQSKKGETSASAYSANTWYGFYQKEKEYSEKNNLTNVVGSSMIWGSQYDQMMIWMQNNGYNVASITPKTGLSRNTGNNGVSQGITGKVETDKINNVYDLLGNGYELTLEADDNHFRVYRGGRYDDSSAPSLRNIYGPHYANDSYSSRLILYVK